MSSRPEPTEAERQAGIQELWKRFRATGDSEARDGLILFYSPVVKYVAGRIAAGLPRHIERQDLVSAGVFGLMEALERFEPERGFRFETYAVPRIKGAILDELRSLDWLPRSVRDQTKAVDRTIARLGQELGRAPTEEEVAEAMGISLEKLGQLMLDSTAMGYASLDAFLPGGEDQSGTLADLIEDPEAVDPAARAQLVDAIESLPERERLIVTLYYYEGMNLAEIGEVMGISESRVCQLHGRAVKLLRSDLVPPY